MIYIKHGKPLLYSLYIVLILSLTSCITPLGLTSSSTPLQGVKIVENCGKGEGTSGSFSILGLFSIGRPDIDDAIKEAVASKGGDALINVRMYEKSIFLVVGIYTQVIITGEVIKFEKKSLKK